MGLTNGVTLQLQTILKYFYKLLLWPTFNITFSFIYNLLSHYQFVKIFVKEFESLTFSLTNMCH